MNPISVSTRVKFGELVYHDRPYLHPQLNVEVDRDFFNRSGEKQKAEILGIPTNKKPIAIIGERRSGKTSLLRLLHHRLDSDRRFVSLDVSFNAVNSARELVREILDTLCLKLELDERESRLASRNSDSISEYLGALKRVAERVPDRTIVISIDEFDSMIIDQMNSESQKREMLGLINAIVENESIPVKLALAMSRDPSKIETGYTSPLTAKAEQIHLEPFSRSDTEDMIRGILQSDFSLSDHLLEGIFRLSGGWPYFTKAILHYLIQLPESDGWLEQAREHTLRDRSLSDTLGHIYQKHWDDAERTVILLISHCSGEINNNEAQVLDPSLKAAARDLVSRGYLEETSSGYRFRIGLFHEWFPRWHRFEEQAHKYIKDILPQLSQFNKHWDEGEEEVIKVSLDDVHRRGLF